MIEDLYSKYLEHPRISTDSRKVEPDSIFVCLKGERFDGNAFAVQALEQGAAFVITERQDLRDDERCIVVDDALQTLQDLARHHRQQLSIPVVGVTGTNGKTTTKELINTVLSLKFRTTCTQGNLNNHIGVPLTLLSIKPTDEMAVVEMGANHPGEIEFLCTMSQPTCGVITNVGKAHLEGFGSFENIVYTKKALYRSVMQRQGTLFVNENDEVLRQGLDYDKVVYYAQGGEGNVVSMSPFLRIKVCGREIDTHVTGAYNVYNFLAAAAIGRFFGIDDSVIADGLSRYEPTNHRSQISKVRVNTIISDYYNANPTSMEAAVRNLALLEAPRKLAVLGDMLELGAVSESEHLRIMELCRTLRLDAIFVGNEFGKHHPERWFADVAALNEALAAHPVVDTLVLVKGSNGIHLDKLSALLQ